MVSRELFVAVASVAGDNDSPKRLGRRIGLHNPYFPGAIESVKDAHRHDSPYAVKAVLLQYEELADFLGLITAEISTGAGQDEPGQLAADLDEITASLLVA